MLKSITSGERGEQQSAVGLLALVIGLALFLLATTGLLSTEAASVTPELLPGASNEGKTCADNQGSGQVWSQLKVEPPANGTYSDGTLTVTISNYSDATNSFDWASNIGVDAVIVKNGVDGANLYRYNPPAGVTGDTGLNTPNNGARGISHITFCYDVTQPSLTPTQPPCTPTPEPTSTDTPEPTSTNTPDPTSTNTPEATSTNTPEATSTNTPEATSTNTPEATSTNTPEATSTNTPLATEVSAEQAACTPTPEVCGLGGQTPCPPAQEVEGLPPTGSGSTNATEDAARILGIILVLIGSIILVLTYVQTRVLRRA